MKKTKIICTMGPNTNDRELMKKLVENGMDIARFNFSHGDHEEQKSRMDMLKAIREEAGKPIAILLDTKGPEIRTGVIKDDKKVTLVEGQKFTLTTKDVEGDANRVSITYEGLVEDVEIGNKILIDDGLIELEVKNITDTDIICRVINGGELGQKKGVNVPNVPVRLPALTEKDRQDIIFGVEQGVDFMRLGLDKAARMAALAAQRDILFSVHAPYYISMSSLEEDKRLNSIQYLLQSAAVCRALGGRRIIFHSGSCGKQSREAALEKALDTMRRAVAALDEAGFEDMTLCPETMGKVGQLGTLDEVLTLCGVDSRITPCIDFGHLNARTLGGIQTKADYAAILDRMAEVLGDDRARQFHVHFSRIEYSAGGEKRHWTFADTQFGPEPQPLMELLAERQLTPVVICESAGTQAEDAQTMQQMYRAARNV